MVSHLLDRFLICALLTSINESSLSALFATVSPGSSSTQVDCRAADTTSQPSTVASRADASSALSLYAPWESSLGDDVSYHSGYDPSTVEYREIYDRPNSFLG